MSTESQVSQIFEKIEFLFERYSLERRATTQPFLLQVVREHDANYKYEPDDEVVREVLMEHVGSLPVLATAVYPYIHDDDVDLGKALTQLAIHDIGELITGDEMTFTKKASAKDPEQQAALKLLDPYYHDLYRDAESKTSKSAKFAKSIDKIAPDFFDYFTPADITVLRFKHFVGIEKDQIISLVIEHKRPYMLWNPFMTELHKYLLDKLATKLGVENPES